MPTELEELEDLYKAKEYYKWEDDDKIFLKRLKDIQTRYMALAAPKKVKKDEKEGAPPPRFKKWETVKVVQAADFGASYQKLNLVEKTEWVPDKWARGSIMNFEGEKDCAWRRRMSKDGKHFARVVHFSEGFALQKGILANAIDLSEDSASDDEEAAAKEQEEPEMTAAPVPAAAGGKRRMVSSGATGQDKKGKGQASSSKATLAPEELPVKRQRKPVKK